MAGADRVLALEPQLTQHHTSSPRACASRRNAIADSTSYPSRSAGCVVGMPDGSFPGPSPHVRVCAWGTAHPHSASQVAHGGDMLYQPACAGPPSSCSPSLARTEHHDAAAAKLEHARQTATKEELPLIDKALASMAEFREAMGVVDNEPARAAHLSAGTRLYLELLRMTAARYPDDVATMRILIATLGMIPFQLINLGIEGELDPAPIRRETVMLARALVQRFPADGRSWRLLGWTLSNFDEPLEAMRAYARCDKVDPSLTDCASSLGELRASYTMPYCDGNEIRATLSWHEGLDHPAPGAARANDPLWNGPGQLHVRTAAQFAAKDLLRVQAGVAHETNIKNGVQSPDEAIVRLILRPEIRKPFAQWLDALQKRDAFLVLMVGPKVLVETHSSSFGYEERAEWSIFRTSIDELCTRTKVMPLPPELAP